jgi:broad specificity phosphatase PhoE
LRLTALAGYRDRVVLTTILFIRHGVTDWSREGRVHGQLDVPLNADGESSAEALGQELARVGVAELISSPQLRAVQTAEILARHLGVHSGRDPRLQELKVGRWEGSRGVEVVGTEEYQRFLADPVAGRAPDGESLTELRDRALLAVGQALGDTEVGARLGVVTHGGVIRVLLAHYLGLPLGDLFRFRLAPCSVTALGFIDDRRPPRVLAINHSAPLDRVVTA